MNHILSLIKQLGILPCFQAVHSADLLGIAAALRRTGIPYMNIEVNDFTAAQAENAGVTVLNLSQQEKELLKAANVRFVEAEAPQGMPEGSKSLLTLLENEIYGILDLKLGHVGINSRNEAEADGIMALYKDLLGLAVQDTRDSFFVGTLIEVMKHPFLGENGHIALGTKNIDLALRHYTARGYEFNTDTAKYDSDGRLVLIYFKNEFGGFAVHFKQL